MWKRPLVLGCLMALVGTSFAPLPAVASHDLDSLEISITRAPVDPDGDVAGTPTDLVVTFRDIDPRIEGVGLKAGGTVEIRLPVEFVNTGRLPVAATGSAPDCAPPLVDGCSTAVFLQGWPQSPVLPFPAVAWDSTTNTIIMTAEADWFPAGMAAPGPKQVHLQLFGFDNPQRPGQYPLTVEIKPDPATDEALRGSGLVRISPRARPNINPNSLANGVPPPPFANTLYQSVNHGGSSLTMAFYLWDRQTDAYLGLGFPDGSSRNRPLLDADGRRVGSVLVSPPKNATAWSLESGGPSSLASAIITGFPTGLLTAVLHTDPSIEGTYRLDFLLFGGNSVRHTIDAR